MISAQTVLSRTDIRTKVIAALFFAGVTAACSQIALHLPYTPVPVTLQTMAVVLSGLVLGRKWGAISQIQYLGMGAIGMPVFSGFTGGLLPFAGPSGGYLIGFVAGAYAAGWLFERFQSKTSAAAWIAGVLGIAGIYAFGSAWLAVWLMCTGAASWGAAMVASYRLGIVPFIGIDILKAIAASSLALGGRWSKGLIHNFRQF